MFQTSRMLKNVKGDETYTVNEDNAYEWAANGDDIYYQGTGTTELPVKLKIKLQAQRQNCFCR